MGEILKFDYYYGTEAEQFSFYRVPRLLIKDKRFSKLSSDAKLLYGLMLDRMSLSMKNGWMDEQNRAYIIYTVENVTEDLCCGKDKAVKVMAELDAAKGIGLIEKVRRGLGKPDIIYVKNFIGVETTEEKKPANAGNITEVGKTEFKKSENQNSGSRENRIQEYGNTEVSRSEKPYSVGRENSIQEVGISEANYNNKSYTLRSYTDHIYSSAQDVDNSAGRKEMNGYEIYKQIIKENIEYDYLVMDKYISRNELDELVSLMTEVVAVERDKVRINGTDYPYQVVKSSFLKLNSSHIRFVLECMSNNTTKITNMRSYLLTTLFNAPNIMSNYYRSEVSHDMYGGGWDEKGIGLKYVEDEDKNGN